MFVLSWIAHKTTFNNYITMNCRDIEPQRVKMLLPINVPQNHDVICGTSIAVVLAMVEGDNMWRTIVSDRKVNLF